MTGHTLLVIVELYRLLQNLRCFLPPSSASPAVRGARSAPARAPSAAATPPSATRRARRCAAPPATGGGRGLGAGAVGGRNWGGALDEGNLKNF